MLDRNQYYYLMCETYYQFNSFLIHTDSPLDERDQRLINLSPRCFDSGSFYQQCVAAMGSRGSELERCDQMRLYVKTPSVFWGEE